MEEQPEDASLQQMQPSYEPPTPPEPPLTVALLVGGPGTAAARLESFRAAVGLAQVRPECDTRGQLSGENPPVSLPCCSVHASWQKNISKVASALS
jgi:hypothetical protein